MRAAHELPWTLPGCAVAARVDPQTALRRHLVAALGFDPGPLTPQEPFDYHVAGHAVHTGVHAAQVVRDEAVPVGYAELAWVAPHEVTEFALDSVAAQVLAPSGPHR